MDDSQSESKAADVKEIKQAQKHIKNDEEKKEMPSFKRKDESAQWKKYLNADKVKELLLKLKEYKCEYHMNQNGSVTFYPSPFLSDNELGKKVLNKIDFKQSKQFSNIMKETGCDIHKLEALYDKNCKIIESPNDLHAFIVAIEIAYFKHYPLKLSPSQIWILILQSIGIHIDQNAEKLRKKFVTHEGKKDLIVERPDFVKG